MSRYFMMLMVLLATAANGWGARTTSKVLIVPQSAQTDITPPSITITSPDLKRDQAPATRQAKLVVAGRATNAKGIASVSVNGTTAQLDERGNFSAEILLKPGKNLITVVALDVAGYQGVEKFQLSRQGDAVALPSSEEPEESGKNYALVIGINQYQQLTKLNTAANDAQEVAKVLREQYGFTATLLLDEKATRAAILRELNTIKNRMAANDSLIIFYAGHGSLDKVTETSFWLPVDAGNSDEMSNWLEAKTITDQLKRSQARQILVVADSCYSGTISRSVEPRQSPEEGTREIYLKRMTLKPSRVLIASGGNEPVSDSGGLGHSIFTDIFLKALKDPFDKRFTAEELMTRHLKESVAGRSAQTPEYKAIRDSGHDSGDFVFNKLH